MARRDKHYLSRALGISIGLHLAVLSLQFGISGKGWPALGWNWGEREASVPNVHSVTVPARQVELRVGAVDIAVTPSTPLPLELPASRTTAAILTPTLTPATLIVTLRPPPPQSRPTPLARRIHQKTRGKKGASMLSVAQPPTQKTWFVAPPATGELPGKPDKEEELPPPPPPPVPPPQKAKAAETPPQVADAAAAASVLAQTAAETQNRRHEQAQAQQALRARERAEEAQRQRAEQAEAERIAARALQHQQEEEARAQAQTQAQATAVRRQAEQEALAARDARAQKAAEEAARAEAAALRQRAEATAQAARAREQVRQEQERLRLAAAAEAEATARAAEEKRAQAAAARMIEEQRRAAQRLAELQQAAAQVAAAAEARARAEALAQAQAEAAAQAAQAAREEAARREQARQQALAAERAAEQARMASAAAAAANLANQAAAAATPARPGAAMASQALAMARRGMSDLPINPPMNLERPAEPARRTSFLGRNPSEIQLSFYGDSWDEKIRRIGHINYPRIPRDAAYSAVVVAVRIRSDGSLESVNIVNSSGHRELDQATRRIIEMCAPFAAFPPDLRRSFDVVEIRRTLSFPDRPPLLISP